MSSKRFRFSDQLYSRKLRLAVQLNGEHFEMITLSLYITLQGWRFQRQLVFNLNCLSAGLDIYIYFFQIPY